MKVNENHRRRYILITLVVTQATIKLYSMTGPIPFLIIGPGQDVLCTSHKPNAHKGIYIQISYVILDSMCDWGGGGESHRWGTFTIWYFIRGGGGGWRSKSMGWGGGGIPCDTGFNSPTEKVAENIVIWEILEWVHIISKVLTFST